MIKVALSGAAFATSGSNLFNCTTPAFPANGHGVSTGEIDCSPTRNHDGTYSTTPVIMTQEVGCGDGHGAAIIVTCAGIAGSTDITGSAELVLAPSCNKTSETGATNGEVLTFSDLASGASQSMSLQSCGVFGNFCGSSNECAFNSFSATLTVTHVVVKK